MRWISVCVLSVLAVMARLGSAVPPSACEQCQRSNTCLPPHCSCCRDNLDDVPNVGVVSQIPQIVFFTFDDAVTSQVSGFYQELFDSARKNPNGCPISMTLFISHDNTNYRLVSEFYEKGMEIASHSVTHSHMNDSNFLQEAKSQKENLAKLANVPIDEITGWRSPFLKPTGDLQPDALKKLGYTYDATLTYSKRSLNERPPGPFTLDFGFPYECQVKPCPTQAHPGFWEVPVVSLMDYKQLYDCVDVDGCMNAPPDEKSAYKFLWDNFNNYYTTTRMPFGINMHPSWFFYPDRLRAMDRFIKKLVSMNDVYIVSANKMLEWLKNPTPLSKLNSFAPWACNGNEQKFNTGPVLVKTNLPPPSNPISWFPHARIGSRDRMTTRVVRPKNTFTPAPIFPQRRFTAPSRASLRQRVFTSRAPDAAPVQRFSSVRGNSRNDFSRQLDIQQQKIREEILKRQLRNWQLQRRRQNASPVAKITPIKTNDAPKVTVQPTQPTSQQPDAVPPPRKTLSQREIMEQHEQRLRQHQLLEERQRRLERERLQQQESQAKAQQARQPAPRPRQPDNAAPKPAPTRKQQHVLWSPSSDLRPSETRQGRPVKVQQETIKMWPSTSPTRAPAVRQRSGRRFSPRTGSTELTRLRDRLRRPTAVVEPTRNPAPRIFPYTDAPVWFDGFGNRRSRPQFIGGNRFSRGGSNRRRGFIEPTQASLRVDQSFASIPSHRSRAQNNNTVVLNRLNDLRQNQLTNSRIQTNLFSQQQPIAFQDNSLSRNFAGRSINPSMAQRIAWDNFIRQMFGPH